MPLMTAAVGANSEVKVWDRDLWLAEMLLRPWAGEKQVYAVQQ